MVHGHVRTPLQPGARVHLIGICGTGMGNLAGLLARAGYRVSGSDSHAYPPMSDELRALGIEVIEGYRPENLKGELDAVVVGNVCRVDHPEAQAARERGLNCLSMAGALGELFLEERASLVVAGTHGKTTTASLLAHLLHAGGVDPSFLIGGVASNFGRGHRLGNGEHFVIEGDEYDSAYFEKRPKFLSYAPRSAILTSVEFDHADIYADWAAYLRAFEEFVALLPADGILAVYAGDEGAGSAVRDAKARLVRYAVEGDPVLSPPDWWAVPEGANRFRLFAEGVDRGVYETPLVGRHNLRNTLGALIIAHLEVRIGLDALRAGLASFSGVARRQQLLADDGGVRIFDDFAHHPTAVRETLNAFRELGDLTRLIVAFEPRSATACRKIHQDAYATAFDAADQVWIAPVGRDLPEDERLDTALLASQLQERGVTARAALSVDELVAAVAADARSGDVIVLLSNGDFQGARRSLVEALK